MLALAASLARRKRAVKALVTELRPRIRQSESGLDFGTLSKNASGEKGDPRQQLNGSKNPLKCSL